MYTGRTHFWQKFVKRKEQRIFSSELDYELEALISTVPQSDKLLLIGDINARLGKDHQAWEGAIGPQGVGKCNNNGLLLLRTCGADCWTDHRHVISKIKLQTQPMRRPQGQKVVKRLNVNKLKLPPE